MRIVRPLAVDHTVVEVHCFKLDGAPAEMHELTLQFVNLARVARVARRLR